MTKLEEIEGIGRVYAEKLREAGVASNSALMEIGATSKGRKDLARRSSISEKLILKWVNHVELFRVRGIGSEYADLLEEAGVDTVRELAQRKAENLYQKLIMVNEKKRIVRRAPTQDQVRDWIIQAKHLPGLISY